MRQCKRNKRTLYALNYNGMTDVTDSDGFLTGEKAITYSSAVEMKANISGARGTSSVEIFGTDIQYDKSISLSKAYFDKLGLNENSVFFIDKAVAYSGTIPLYDYKVVRIAETVNEVVIAVSKVRDNG